MRFVDVRELAIYVVDGYRGEPYIWGGDNPVDGFDCSGLMVEALKSAGKLPHTGDWNASQLATMFPPAAKLKEGVLVFYNRGTPAHIGHVVMVYAVMGDSVFTIGAEGGGSATKTREDAVKQDAYVRVRPIVPGYVKLVDPFL